MKDVLARIREKSRFDTFRAALESLGTPPGDMDAHVARYAEAYNAAVQEGISKKGLVDGAEKLLKDLSGRFQLYINSGTFEPALHETANNIGIGKFFRGIYGGYATKEENFEKIMKQENANTADVIFVGDGEVDAIEAERCGVFFVGIANEFNGWKGEERFPLVKNVLEIKKLLNL